ncbi:MAG: DUF368 domain-containing protein [Treponema sp.]|nr:DUF368 domain-containing protein [Treponema sp.]
MLKDLRNFINGSVYGMTLIIPGVSATLFAIILKFYDELIQAVNHFREDYRGNSRRLLVFLLGVIVGSVVFSSLVVYLLQAFPLPAMLFFTGLLTGMVPLIASKAAGPRPGITPRRIALAAFSLTALVAASRAVAVTGIYPEQAAAAMTVPLALYVFLAGIINGATLVIPGLSGAFLLLVMGLYPLILYAISSIGYFFLDMTNTLPLRHSAVVLLPFGAGAAIGFLCMARLMEKLLRETPQAVYAVILGLLLGSVITLALDQLRVHLNAPPLHLAAGALTFCAGCAVAYMLGKRH